MGLNEYNFAQAEISRRFNLKLLALMNIEPIAEQSMAPYFAEALEAHPDEMTLEELIADLADPNAGMIARDRLANFSARPAAPVVIQEPAKTSHSPIAGLTRLGAVDHLFGTRFVHGD